MRFLIFICLLLCATNVQAQDCDRSVEFKCMRPCDVFKGVGCYLKDTTCRVGEGLGMMITAPFKAKFCLPKPEKYRYTPGQWHYTPPKFERLKYPDPVLPPKDSIHPLHYNPNPSTFVTLFEKRF